MKRVRNTLILSIANFMRFVGVCISLSTFHEEERLINMENATQPFILCISDGSFDFVV